MSPIQKYCALALASNATDTSDFIEQAGLFGSPGVAPGVKIFWRNISHKIVTTNRYKTLYKDRLDVEYKKNENRTTNDFIGSGKKSPDKLPLTQLKLRARSYTMGVFVHDLLEDFRNDY